jgi:acylphosphatase
MKSYKFTISGKVQGVYYRVSVKNKALSYGYSGYVKNMSDGTVEACVTCHDSQLDNFCHILKKGSTFSNVTSITHLECDEFFSGKFEVR